jgi:hypothetical protein
VKGKPVPRVDKRFRSHGPWRLKRLYRCRSAVERVAARLVDHFGLEQPRTRGRRNVLIHSLYFKAGLLKQNNGGRYALCVHSLRKFFKTQLMALGVQADYVDYMMGHTISTYHDIQSKGVEFLRGLYANSGLRIRPKGSLTPKEQLRAIARGFGLNPEEAARLLTSSEPHRTYVSREEQEEHEIRVLCDAITERIKEKILASQ